jgi:uncharacterized membrane protein
MMCQVQVLLRRPSSYLNEHINAGSDATRHLPIAFLIIAYAVRFGKLTVDVLHAHGQPAFDMGIPDQGIWLLSRFHDPFVTVIGRQLFGDHTSYIYLLLVPVYWVYPHTAALLVIQAMLLSGAAIPIYALARHLLRSTPLATLAAAAYLLNPALQQGNMEQFHVESFEVALIATALYAAVVWRPRLLLVAVVLLLLCKEDAAMYAVPLGVWVLFRRDRRVGLVIVGGATLSALIDNLVVIPTLIGVANIHGNRFPFNGIVGSLRELVRHPAQVWSYAGSEKRPRYLWQMAFSAGLVFVVAPEIALLAIVGVGVNIWSTFGYQHEIIYHYSLPIVPILACGTIWAISRMSSSRLRTLASGAVLISALWACTLWGLAPFSNEKYAHTSPTAPTVLATNQILHAVPSSGAVSAYYGYVAALDHRTQIYMWPNPFKASYWGTFTQEGKRLPYASEIQYVVLPVSLSSTDTTWAAVVSQFHAIASNSTAVLYQRN